MTESELREQVVSLAHALGWKVFSLPINRTVRPVKDAVGYPDLTLARHGRVLFMELKTETGVLTDVQFAWMRELPYFHVIRPSDIPSLPRVLA